MDLEENLRRWKVSRRRFLEIVGAASGVSVIGALAPGLAGSRREDPDDRGKQVEAEARKRPHRVRQWAMVIDLRKCDGCQSQNLPPRCTEACNFGHFVPEPMEWIEVYEHELAADAAHTKVFPGHPVVPAALEGTRFVPTPCMQCQNPPCVNVCPVGATWSTPEGVVLIDQDRCIGCRMCMAACPYERRFFTWGKPALPPEAMFVERNPVHQVPLQAGVVAKCDFCPEIARAGRLPFCAQACPQKAIYYGDLEEDRATNGREIVKLSRFLSENSASRMKEELGTRPRVYYIEGHGELVGRDPRRRGRLPVRWPYGKADGAKTWKRSGR